MFHLEVTLIYRGLLTTILNCPLCYINNTKIFYSVSYVYDALPFTRTSGCAMTAFSSTIRMFSNRLKSYMYVGENKAPVTSTTHVVSLPYFYFYYFFFCFFFSFFSFLFSCFLLAEDEQCIFNSTVFLIHLSNPDISMQSSQPMAWKTSRAR